MPFLKNHRDISVKILVDGGINDFAEQVCRPY